MLPNFLNFQQIPFLAFTTNFQELIGSTSCSIDPFCNAWEVINLGDIWVNVNGILLKGFPPGHPELTGASIGVAGQYGEIFKGNVNVQSAATTPGSGTTQFLCLFIQKTYVFD
jgi:hypothetical protein